MSDRLLEASLACSSPEEYDATVIAWLEEVVGCDTVYIGAALPIAGRRPAIAGVESTYVSRCEAAIDRYWPDRLALNAAALACGGVVQDRDVFSMCNRDRRPFYREVVAGLGIRAIAVCVLAFRARPVAAIYLGRTAHGAQFDRQLDVLRRALPALALGYVAQRTRSPLMDHEPRLTPREREVLDYAGRGFTNPEIALALGTSTNTVKKQLASLLDKCHVANRTELVARYGG